MTSWRPQRDRLTRPYYLSLAEEIRRAIGDGRLAPDEQVPPHRTLAHELGVSVQTVSRAYDLLVRDKVLSGRVGSGTFVGAARPEPAYPFIESSFNSGLMDLSILKQVLTGWHTDRLRAALAEVAANAPDTAMLSFRPGTALAPYQAAARRWLRLCGVRPDPDRIQLTAGATPAINVAIQTVVPPGGLMATEQFGHHVLVHLCKFLGRRLIGLDCDGDGILPDALEAACHSEKPAALFVTPSGANPQATMAGPARRQALIAVARRFGLRIIENDAWGPLIEDRPRPFAALAPDLVCYITGFSKILLPGLRAGLLVVPDGLHIDAAKRNLANNWSATPLIFEIVCRWIDDGTAMEMVRRQRRLLERRHGIVEAALAGLEMRANRHGLHVWLTLPPPWQSEQFILQLRQSGVAVAPASAFATDAAADAGRRTNAVRISVGPVSEDDLRRGLTTLRDLCGEEPAPAMFGL